jgi:hypothetical protein
MRRDLEHRLRLVETGRLGGPGITAIVRKKACSDDELQRRYGEAIGADGESSIEKLFRDIGAISDAQLKRLIAELKRMAAVQAGEL